MLGFALLLLTTELSCPAGMVPASPWSCIDELPLLVDGEHPRLALSATPEHYVPLHGQTWDVEALCAERGARVCADDEWQAACEGTPRDACPSQELAYRAPRWDLVGHRNSDELRRLNRSSSWRDYPGCVSRRGARMMGAVEEWVRSGSGYAFSAAYWSRPATCGQFVRTHAADWHDYVSGGRCCASKQPTLRRGGWRALPLL